MTFREHYKSDGFILFDVILALTLSAVLIGLLSYASLNARSLYERSKLKKEITMIYQKHAADFDDLMPGDSVTRTYPHSTSTSDVSITAHARWYGNDRVETVIEASSSGRTVSFRAVRRYPHVSDTKVVGTSVCSPEYDRISNIEPIVLPIDALLPLTDLQVRNGIAYVTSDSNKQSDPDLFVFDIRDAKHPRLLSSINTGPGLRSLVVAGRYVHAAAASTAAQLHVIRLNDMSNIQLSKKYQLPLPEASTSPPVGTVIWYDDQRIYLGTEKWDGQEFAVIDIRNPENPTYLGGFETGSKVTDVFVRNGIGYVTASDQYQMRMFDVRTQNPAAVHTFSPSGWQRQEGVSVIGFEEGVLLGRTSGGFDIIADTEVFLWPDAISTPHTQNIPGGLYGAVLSRSNVFAITHTNNQELSVFDRTLSTTTASYHSLPVLPQAITCDLDKIYILAKTTPAIYAVTFQ